MSERGKIYSVTEVDREHAPSGFGELAPYGLAIVELVSGLKVTARLTDLERDEAGGLVLPQIGEEVEIVIRKGRETDPREIINYQYTFRPILEPASVEQIDRIRQEIAKWIIK